MENVKNLFNAVDFKKSTPTTAKNLARAEMVKVIRDAMIAAYGEDNVSEVDFSEISVAIGIRTDSDGFDREVCVNIAPVAKEVEDRATTKNVFEAYDRLGDAEQFAKKKADKEKAEKEKAAAKEKAKKKLEEAKAKKEAEKKKRITEKLAAKNQPEPEPDEEVNTIDETEEDNEE